MIRQIDNVFILETKNTTYAFSVLDTGYLEHLYYGPKIRLTDDDGNIISLAMSIST